MRSDVFKIKFWVLTPVLFLFGAVNVFAAGNSYEGDQQDQNRKILKQGLLGAGTGAIAAGASGGKAGTGALIGAGTNVIGGALLDTLMAPSQPAAPQGYAQQGYAQPVYQQAPPPPQQQYAQPQQGYAQEPPPPQPVYYQQAPPPRAPQQDATRNILKQGLLGAGTGAIAAGASGGKAGKGALIGAGTNIIGGALLDMLSQPSRPRQQPVYYPPPPQQTYQQAPAPAQQKKIIRKFDAEGNVISEEEIYQ